MKLCMPFIVGFMICTFAQAEIQERPVYQPDENHLPQAERMEEQKKNSAVKNKENIYFQEQQEKDTSKEVENKYRENDFIRRKK